MLKVLVTRPIVQGERLGSRLSKQGFTPILAPMIKIAELGIEARQSQISALKKIVPESTVIAISSNAFTMANRLLEEEGIPVPESVKWFAVGSATAQVMREAGICPKTPQSSFTTEGLLALEDLLDVRNKSVVILAGTGGRRKLEQALDARGARVDRIELYQRVALTPEEVQISSEPDAMIAMSGETIEGLGNYLRSSGRMDWLDKPVFVPSARVAQLAFDAQFKKVRITENPTEESLRLALCRLASEV